MTYKLTWLPASVLLLACAPAPNERLGSNLEAAAIDDHWVGTWAVAPQGDGTPFNDQTLRQVAHISLGGSSVRVHVSNVFGTGPLSLDSVHVAKRATGSSIVPASDQALLFGGQSSIVIAAGQAAQSDAVALDLATDSDVVVSFHVQSGGNPTTAHGTGLQDNYVVSGSHASDENLAGAQTKGSYYFLTGVDVQNANAWGSIVTLGASITDGVASGGNANKRWPNDLAKRLSTAGIPVGVLNEGISGNRLLADGAGESALKRFDRDVLSQAGVRWVVFSDDPINDLGGGNPPSGDQLLTGLKELVMRAHTAGLQFWCSTLTPYQGSGGWKPEGETARTQIDAFIRGADSGCDAIVDQDTATHDPAKPTWYLPDYDAGDHLHPNEKGLQAIADAVKLDGFVAPPGSAGAGGAGGSGGSAGTATGGSGGATTGGTGSGAMAGSGGAGMSGGNAAGGSTPGAGSGGAAGTQPLMTGGAAGTSSSSPSSDGSCSCKLARIPRTPTNAGTLLLAAVGLTIARRSASSRRRRDARRSAQ